MTVKEGKSLKLKLGDQYRVPYEDGHFVAKITVLGKNTTFMVTGEHVENPAQPRVMPTVAFVRMLKLSKAEKLNS